MTEPIPSTSAAGSSALPADTDATLPCAGTGVENLPCSLSEERVSSRPATDSPTSADRAQAVVPLRLNTRIRLLVLGFGLLALLGVARWLEPAASGMGTHRQLGLPECTTVTLFGVRCPSCGMTTSWSHFTRGEIAEAAAANTGGLLLALSAGLWGVWAVVSAAKSRHWIGRPTSVPVMIWMGTIVGVTVVQWIARL